MELDSITDNYQVDNFKTVTLGLPVKCDIVLSEKALARVCQETKLKFVQLKKEGNKQSTHACLRFLRAAFTYSMFNQMHWTYQMNATHIFDVNGNFQRSLMALPLDDHGRYHCLRPIFTANDFAYDDKARNRVHGIGTPQISPFTYCNCSIKEHLRSVEEYNKDHNIVYCHNCRPNVNPGETIIYVMIDCAYYYKKSTFYEILKYWHDRGVTCHIHCLIMKFKGMSGVFFDEAKWSRYKDLIKLELLDGTDTYTHPDASWLLGSAIPYNNEHSLITTQEQHCPYMVNVVIKLGPPNIVKTNRFESMFERVDDDDIRYYETPSSYSWAWYSSWYGLTIYTQWDVLNVVLRDEYGRKLHHRIPLQLMKNIINKNQTAVPWSQHRWNKILNTVSSQVEEWKSVDKIYDPATRTTMAMVALTFCAKSDELIVNNFSYVFGKTLLNTKFILGDMTRAKNPLRYINIIILISLILMLLIGLLYLFFVYVIYPVKHAFVTYDTHQYMSIDTVLMQTLAPIIQAYYDQTNNTDFDHTVNYTQFNTTYISHLKHQYLLSDIQPVTTTQFIGHQLHQHLNAGSLAIGTFLILIGICAFLYITSLPSEPALHYLPINGYCCGSAPQIDQKRGTCRYGNKDEHTGQCLENEGPVAFEYFNNMMTLCDHRCIEYPSGCSHNQKVAYMKRNGGLFSEPNVKYLATLHRWIHEIFIPKHLNLIRCNIAPTTNWLAHMTSKARASAKLGIEQALAGPSFWDKTMMQSIFVKKEGLPAKDGRYKIPRIICASDKQQNAYFGRYAYSFGQWIKACWSGNLNQDFSNTYCEGTSSNKIIYTAGKNREEIGKMMYQLYYSFSPDYVAEEDYSAYDSHIVARIMSIAHTVHKAMLAEKVYAHDDYKMAVLRCLNAQLKFIGVTMPDQFGTFMQYLCSAMRGSGQSNTSNDNTLINAILSLFILEEIMKCNVIKIINGDNSDLFIRWPQNRKFTNIHGDVVDANSTSFPILYQEYQKQFSMEIGLTPWKPHARTFCSSLFIPVKYKLLDDTMIDSWQLIPLCGKILAKWSISTRKWNARQAQAWLREVSYMYFLDFSAVPFMKIYFQQIHAIYKKKGINIVPPGWADEFAYRMQSTGTSIQHRDTYEILAKRYNLTVHDLEMLEVELVNSIHKNKIDGHLRDCMLAMMNTDVGEPVVEQTVHIDQYKHDPNVKVDYMEVMPDPQLTYLSQKINDNLFITSYDINHISTHFIPIFTINNKPLDTLATAIMLKYNIGKVDKIYDNQPICHTSAAYKLEDQGTVVCHMELNRKNMDGVYDKLFETITALNHTVHHIIPIIGACGTNLDQDTIVQSIKAIITNIKKLKSNNKVFHLQVGGQQAFNLINLSFPDVFKNQVPITKYEKALNHEVTLELWTCIKSFIPKIFSSQLIYNALAKKYTAQMENIDDYLGDIDQGNVLFDHCIGNVPIISDTHPVIMTLEPIVRSEEYLSEHSKLDQTYYYQNMRILANRYIKKQIIKCGPLQLTVYQMRVLKSKDIIYENRIKFIPKILNTTSYTYHDMLIKQDNLLLSGKYQDAYDPPLTLPVVNTDVFDLLDARDNPPIPLDDDEVDYDEL